MRFTISVLGSFKIACDGVPLSLPTHKAAALLAYLAMHPNKAIRRESLATILWPESANSRGNLRAELARLRRAIREDQPCLPFLDIRRETIRLHTAQVECDVHHIWQLLERCHEHPHSSPETCGYCCEILSQVVDLYHEPLLSDFPNINSVEFESWLEIDRQRLHNSILSALEMLQSYLVRLGSHHQVIKYACRHLALQPWLEAPTLRLMTALTLSNARQEALDVYETLRSHLDIQFGAEPGPVLTRTYHQIRSRGLSVPVLSLTTSPYPGLAAFNSDNAIHFYGRESTVNRLAEAVSLQPFVLLTGPSGSGKSSVVQAGLLPRLDQQSAQDSPLWSVITLRPGPNPLRSLVHAIFPAVEQGGATYDMADALRQNTMSLRQIVRQSMAGSFDDVALRPRRVLLVVDQFEEVFTLCDDEEARRLFLTGLLEGIDEKPEKNISVSILIVMRADFMGQALSYRSLSNIAQQHVVFLGVMSATGVRRAIVNPARLSGVEYEPGLIDRILDDLDDSPGQLPLLQFALTLLWRARKVNWITHEAYNDIGGVSGALTHYADGFFAQLELVEQDSVQRIFMQLIHLGQGVGDTRRQATRVEIGERNWPLIQKLAGARLVVTDRDSGETETVEVIHEALIQKWERLRKWIAADRAFHLWQNRIRDSLGIWERQEQSTSELLRGFVLAEAEDWLSERADEIDERVVRFIQASTQARKQREERANQQRKALEQAVIESRRMEQRALARQLGAQADQQMKRKCDLGLLLSKEALRRSVLPQDRTDLLVTLEINPFLEKILHGHQSSIFYLTIGSDNNTLVSSDERNHIQIWQLDTLERNPLLPQDGTEVDDVALDPLGRWIATVRGNLITLWEVGSEHNRILDPGHSAGIFRLRFSSDGRFLLSAATDGELCLWDTQTGAKDKDMPPVPVLTSLQLGPDADVLAVAEGDNGQPGVRLVQRKSGDLLAPPLLGHREHIHGLTFSRDGSRLATASFDGTVRLWDTATGQESTLVLTEHTGRPLFAAFSPDGRLLATGGTDNLLLLWDAQTGERLDIQALYHNNWVRAAVFSEDSKMLYSGDSDGKIYIWNLGVYGRLSGHTKRVRVVDVSPDGETLATVGFDSSVRLWDTSTHRCYRTLSIAAGREAMAGLFSPDGASFAVVDNRGELTLWETTSWTFRRLGPNRHDEPSIALTFSLDSRLLAQGDLDGYVSLWDVTSGQLIQPPKRLHSGLASWVLALAFSSDGTTLTTGGKDGTIGFWSVPEFAPKGPRIEAHTNWTTHLLYTVDGQTLISTSSDGTVRFWNPHTREEAASPLTGHEGQVWQAHFNPMDGERVLVTLGGNGSVIWWDLENRVPLGPPLRTGIETESMALSPDGRWLFLGSFDANTYAWQPPKGSWAERSGQIANRSLTQEEWQSYMGDLIQDGGDDLLWDGGQPG